MSVVEVKEAAEHMRVTLTTGLKKEFSCPYIVTVDSPRDDGLTIIQYFESIGRGIGSEYRYGNWEDNSVQLKSIAPVRRTGSVYVWDVVLSYGPPDNEDIQRTNEEGEPTDNPVDYRWEILSGVRMRQVPVARAWNVDVMPIDGGAGGYQRPVNTLGPVVNSAGVVYDPPLVKEIPETVIRFSGNLANYAQVWIYRYAGCINNGLLIWSQRLRGKYGFTGQHWAAHCVYCAGASASYGVENGYGYWKYTYEFVMRDATDEFNPGDFYEYMLDRGLSRRMASGDPDGRGGTVSASDLKTGMARAGAIRDVDGERVPELVLLDGKGQPLTGTAEKEGVYFRWRVHPEVDFKALPLDIFD